MRLQGETRELSVTLDDADLVQAGADLCDAVQEADNYEADLEERKSDWRATLKTLKEELVHLRKVASEAAEVVRTGQAKRDVSCTWLYALGAGYAFLTRDDTGELVTHRKLKDEERQMEIGEASFAEPTPEQLDEWLKTLPVNEEQALPEGHAEDVTGEDQAVDLAPAWEADPEGIEEDEDDPALDTSELAAMPDDQAEKLVERSRARR